MTRTYTPIASTTFLDDNGNPVVIEIVEVDAQLALKWLERNIENNRTVKTRQVGDLAYDLENGSFIFNGTTIKFDNHGNLIDGQHRLLAIVRTGISAKLLIVRGLGDEVLPTLDQETMRTVPQILEISGQKIKNVNSVVAAQMIRMLGNQDLFKLTTNRPLVADLVQENKDVLEHWVTWASSLVSQSQLYVDQRNAMGRGRQRKAVGVSVLAALGSIMSERGAEEKLIDQFFKGLVTGVVTDESLTPVVTKLRKWVSQTSPLIRVGGTQLPSLFRTFDTIIKVYNYWLQGVEVQQIKSDGYSRTTGRVEGIRWIEDIRWPIKASDEDVFSYSEGGQVAVEVPEFGQVLISG